MKSSKILIAGACLLMLSAVMAESVLAQGGRGRGRGMFGRGMMGGGTSNASLLAMEAVRKHLQDKYDMDDETMEAVTEIADGAQEEINAERREIKGGGMFVRGNVIESVGDTVARYRTRPPFNEFTPDALQDYFQFGLKRLPDDAGFQLACPPETEARIYQTAFTNPGIVDAIRTIVEQSAAGLLDLDSVGVAARKLAESSFDRAHSAAAFVELLAEFIEARSLTTDNRSTTIASEKLAAY